MKTFQSTRPHGYRRCAYRYLSVAILAVSALGLASAKPALAAKREFNMTIEEVRIQVAPDLKYNVFAFDGQVPGPLIHVKQGDEVTVNVTNNTSLPHTMSAAMRGAITVLMNSPDADPKLGKGDNILLR